MEWKLKLGSNRIWNLFYNGRVIVQIFRWEFGGPYMVSNQSPLSFLFDLSVVGEDLQDFQCYVENVIVTWAKSLVEK